VKRVLGRAVGLTYCLVGFDGFLGSFLFGFSCYGRVL
jgi:hypothetical protein